MAHNNLCQIPTTLLIVHDLIHCLPLQAVWLIRILGFFATTVSELTIPSVCLIKSWVSSATRQPSLQCHYLSTLYLCRPCCLLITWSHKQLQEGWSGSWWIDTNEWNHIKSSQVSQSVNKSINEWTSQSLSQSVNQPTNQPINQSINQSINSSINSSIDWLTHQHASDWFIILKCQAGIFHWKYVASIWKRDSFDRPHQGSKPMESQGQHMFAMKVKYLSLHQEMPCPFSSAQNLFQLCKLFSMKEALVKQKSPETSRLAVWHCLWSG